jgi:hypothetical protein
MSREVIIESNMPIEDNDHDLFVMFMENRKQSGGGDIEKTERLDSSRQRFKVTYESAESGQQVLAKKSFTFKRYQLTALDSNAKFFNKQNESFEKSTRKIVVKNLITDDDLTVAELYAEFIMPDVEVKLIERSNFVPNTFFITYESDIDFALLQKRYLKKPVIREQRIEILDSYKTRTFIITLKPDLKRKIVDGIKLNCTHEIVNNKFLILQFENEAHLTSLFSMASNEVNMQSLKIDFCHNFVLLKSIQSQSQKQSDNLENQVNKTNGSFNAAQTNGGSKEQCIAAAEASQKQAKLTNEALKKEDKLKKKVGDANIIETIKSAQTRDDFKRLIKAESSNEIILNEREPFAIGLLKIKMFRLEMEMELKKFKAKINIEQGDKLSPIVSIKLDRPDQKTQVLEHLCAFNFNFTLITLAVSDRILTNAETFMEFQEQLNKVADKNIAVFIDLDQSGKSVRLYGLLKPVEKVLKSVTEIMERISKQSSASNKVKSNLNGHV